VIWLVKFLEIWCGKNEIEKRVLNYVTKVQTGELDKRTEEFYAQVYSFFEKIKPEVRISLKKNTPTHLSQKINISEAEIEKLFDKYLKEKNWIKFINIIEYKNNLSESQWELLRENYAMDLEDTALNLDEEILNVLDKLNSENKPALLVFRLLVILTLKEVILSFLNNNQIEEVQPALKQFIFAYNQVDFEYKNSVILEIIIPCVIKEHYHLAKSFLDKILNTSSIENNSIINLFKYILMYFIENKNEDVLLPLGSEKKDIVLELIDVINKSQAYHKMDQK
jgi:hypothetical protein